LTEETSYFGAGAGAAVRPQWRSTAAALFFALTGCLVATAIVNVGQSGIALFYLVFLVPLVALVAPKHLFHHRLDRPSVLLMAFTAVMFLLLWLVTLLQLMLVPNLPDGEVVHFVSRLAFLAYFVIVQQCLRGRVLEKTLIWLRRILIFLFAYGIYQLPAKLLGWPLFLDWLRNDRSFSFYQFDTAGWVGIMRATSVFAEPGQAAVPIVILFILNIGFRGGWFSKFLGWTVLLLFTTLTFSRTAWVVLFVAAITVALLRIRAVRRTVESHRLAMAVACCLAIVLLPAWAYVVAGHSTDESEAARSQSVIAGVHMVANRPILGGGWNSFEERAARYDLEVPAAAGNLSFLHNMVLSYAQQAGIAGLLLAIFPFAVILGWSSSAPWVTYATLTSFLIGAELGGDIAYSPLIWLWLALMIQGGESWLAEDPNHRFAFSPGKGRITSGGQELA